MRRTTRDGVPRLVLGATTPGDAHGFPRPEAATTTENRAVSPEQGALQLAMSTAHDAGEALPRIRTRTLVVHGVDDRVTEVRNASILRDHIGDADLLLLAGARHAYPFERPDANAMIAAFLAG